MTDSAIAAMRKRIDIDPAVLHPDVSERLAIRDPAGDWLVERYDCAVRIYLRVPGDPPRFLSRYVWDHNETDAVIDHLRERAASGDVTGGFHD